MIPSLAQIAYGVFGAWRLAHLDKGGLSFFDDSNQGFLRSFFAAVVAAPAYGAVILMNLGDEAAMADPASLLLIEGLHYLLAWLLWPVIAWHICQSLGKGRFYFRYIVAYNWAYVIVIALVLPVELLAFTAVVPAFMAAILGLLVVAAALAYAGVIARYALEVPTGTAAWLVAVDFVATLGLNWTMSDVAARAAGGV